LEDIEFADDVCLITKKENHMQRKLQKLVRGKILIILHIFPAVVAARHLLAAELV
jgi:hypothetical protein